MNHITLSWKERLMLSNQLKILEKLYPEETEDLAKYRQAIEKGYELHYDDAPNIYPDGECLPPEQCQEVLDILDMYRALTHSYQKLEKPVIEESNIEFPGFDGNNETEQMAYAGYFMNTLGRFEELRDDSEYGDYNSHMQMLPVYGRMLEIWRGYGDERFNLSEEQIKRILDAMAWRET